jgi:hypothetical protein
MKMEYLASDAADYTVIRLYDFTPNEVAQLCDIFASLASGTTCSVALHDQPFIQLINGCRLTLRVGRRDGGIEKVDASGFDCILTQTGWEDELERARWLAQDNRQGNYHHWLLLDIPTEVRLLLSKDGFW